MDPLVNPLPGTVSDSPAQRPLSTVDATYAEQLEHALRTLAELTVAAVEQMERKVGLSSLRALQSLRRQGPCMVTDLANALNMPISTTSRLSDRLADADLISRRVSPTNRRAAQLDLTAAGQAVLDELVTLRAAALSEVIHRMSERERRDLLVGAQAFTRARNQQPPTASKPPIYRRGGRGGENAAGPAT